MLHHSSPLLPCPCRHPSPLALFPSQQRMSHLWISSCTEMSQRRTWPGSFHLQAGHALPPPPPWLFQRSVVGINIRKTIPMTDHLEINKVPFQFQSKKWCVKACVCVLPAWWPVFGKLPVSPSVGCESPALQWHLSGNQQWHQRFWWLTGGGPQWWWYDPVGPACKDVTRCVCVFVSAIIRRWPTTCSVRSWLATMMLRAKC